MRRTRRQNHRRQEDPEPVQQIAVTAMKAGGNSFTPIKKLSGPENYLSWKFNMRMLLLHEGLWGYVDDPESIENFSNELDGRALAKVCLYVEENVQVNIPTDVETAKAAWDCLKEAYETKGLGRKMALQRHIMNVRLEHHRSVRDYIDDVLSTARELKEIKSPLSDEYVGVIMLNNLGPKYESFVMAIENSGVEITSDLVRTRLLSHDVRMAADGKEDSALLSRSQNRFSRVKCYHCGEFGHFQNRCPAKQQQGRQTGNQSDQGGSETSNQQDNKRCMIAVSSDHSALSVAKGKGALAVDSGCTGHMSKKKQCFENYDGRQCEIRLADDSTLKAEGRGDLNVNIGNSGRTMKDVMYVPGLATDLLSVSSMAARGWRFVFDEKCCRIYYKDDFRIDGRVEMEANCVNGLYLLEAEFELAPPASTVVFNTACNDVNDNTLTISDICKITEVTMEAALLVKDFEIWHKRLAHLSPASMRLLRDGMAEGIDFTDDKVLECVPCLQGKMSRAPFPKVARSLKVTGMLDIVHSDVCGPMEVNSWSGGRYFITFTDGFSRRTSVFIMKTKDEAFEKFKTYKAWAENQLGRRIKCLRTDNGREYLNLSFSDFLKENGIEHERTVPYNPEQNGIAERVNRTVNDKARCMLMDSNLDKRYWAEAVNTAVYIKNRVPTRALDKTPQEVWTGSRVDLSHLRVFGCTCYVLVPKEKRKKYDCKSLPCWMVGYSEESKGYRVAPKSNEGTIQVARDVSFLESELMVRAPHLSPAAVSDKDVSDFFLEEEQETPQQLLPSVSDVNTGQQPANVDVNPKRYPTRHRKPRDYGNDFILYLTSVAQLRHDGCSDPINVKEALSRSDAALWQEAMNEEFQSLKDNEVWTLVDRPAEKNVVKCRWVFKIKRAADGQTAKYRARLVAKGFSQKEGVDYFETFSPMVRHSTIRLLFALAAEKGLHIHHLDVKTAFLHGFLKEEVFMELPEGYDAPRTKVCRLKKAVYGLKQASKVWYEEADGALRSIGYERSKHEPCVYIKRGSVGITIIALYVDDFFLFGSDLGEMAVVKDELGRRFTIKDLGEVQECLGMRVRRENGTTILGQEKYAEDVIRRFGMSNCKPVGTPLEPKPVNEDLSPLDDPTSYQRIVGSLMYLAICTRVDLAYSVSFLSQSCAHPTKSDMANAQRVLRYVKGTLNYSLVFQRTGADPVAYADADWANSADRKSYSGCALIYAGGSVSWEAHKQSVVALSPTEAEYVAMADAGREVIFVRGMLEELGVQVPTVVIYNDNQSSHALVSNAARHKRTKHVDIRHHFIRDLCDSGVVKIVYMDSSSMPADVLTKPLARVKHDQCINLLFGW